MTYFILPEDVPEDVAPSISTGLLESNKDVRSWSNDTEGPSVNRKSLYLRKRFHQ